MNEECDFLYRAALSMMEVDMRGENQIQALKSIIERFNRQFEGAEDEELESVTLEKNIDDEYISKKMKKPTQKPTERDILLKKYRKLQLTIKKQSETIEKLEMERANLMYQIQKKEALIESYPRVKATFEKLQRSFAKSSSVLSSMQDY